MKKIIIISLLSLCVVASIFAQRPKAAKTKDRVEAYQIAFITERLNLTSEEAQKFWPIYNQYRDQLKHIRQDNRLEKPIEEMTDSEAEQLIKATFEKETKELELRKEFVQKLRGVLSAKKIARLQGLEKEFKKELLERAKERRQTNK